MKKINELVTKTEKPEHKSKRRAVTFGSFKRAEEKQIQERKDRKHQEELARIAEDARIQKAIADEEARVIKEENTRKRNELITKKLSNAFGTKTDVDFKPVREKVIDKYLPQLREQETLDDYPKPFEEEPALNRELSEFKKKINEHLHKVGFASGSGGGIGDIGDAGDVDVATAKVNGKFLKFDSSSGKFVGADASVNDETIQDTVGAMFSSNTETGITATYQDADGTIDLVIGTLNQDTTGNAATATALETARTIGGTSFDGTANIAVALSAAATALETARTIHGVSFDGTANIDLTEVIQDTVGAMFSSNTETGIAATYEDGDGTVDLVVGTLNQDTTGNAATATALETARNIGGVSFDGTGNIDLPGVNTAGNQNTSGTAAVATTVAITDNESTDEDNAIVFTAGGDVDGGNLGLESDGTLTYNPSTGKITATGFVGDVTGNVSGTAATVTGAAQSNITSLGTLTTLTVDSIIINGTNIGHTSDTDAIDIAADGKTTFSQNIIASGDIELGHASDTTLARSSAGVITIEGNTIATREQLRGDATNGSGVLSDEIIKRKIHIGATISKALSSDSTVGLVAGRLLGGFISQVTVAQNTIFWMPIFIPGEGAGDTTNIASFQFATGHSGTINSTTVKMGLYSLNKFGFPSQLISKSSASSGTTTSTTVTATPDVTEIMPGRYAMALGVAGNSCAIRSNFSSTSAGASFFMEGFSDKVNAPGTKTFGFFRNSALSSDELPTDLSSTTDYNDASSLPIMSVVLGENYAGE